MHSENSSVPQDQKVTKWSPSRRGNICSHEKTSKNQKLFFTSVSRIVLKNSNWQCMLAKRYDGAKIRNREFRYEKHLKQNA